MRKILTVSHDVFALEERTWITKSIPAAIPPPEKRQEAQRFMLNWLVAWVRVFQSTKNGKNVGGAERLLGCYVASERIQDFKGVWNTPPSPKWTTAHLQSSILEREKSTTIANSIDPVNPAIRSVVGEDELAKEHWPVRRTLERIWRDSQEGFRIRESTNQKARQMTTDMNITFVDAWQGIKEFPVSLTMRVRH